MLEPGPQAIAKRSTGWRKHVVDREKPKPRSGFGISKPAKQEVERSSACPPNEMKRPAKCRAQSAKLAERLV